VLDTAYEIGPEVDVELTDDVRLHGGTLAVEPTETDWGTVSAYVAGPHGVLVELYS